MHKLSLIVVLLGGCTRENPLAIGGGDGGGGDGGGECSTLTDRASCEADSNCVALGCPRCDGTQSFVGCFDKKGPLPGFGCPAACASCHGLDELACRAAAGRGCVTATCCNQFTGCLDPTDPPQVCTGDCVNTCSGLDEKSCRANPGCRADYCPTCNPGSSFFSSCDPAGSQPPMCAPLPCPPPASCDQLVTLGQCDARSDCHAVYQPGACECLNCCCTFFSHCAAGGAANCRGPALCNSAPPDCATPACNGMFAVGYTNSCYEGCVRSSACAP